MPVPTNPPQFGQLTTAQWETTRNDEMTYFHTRSLVTLRNMDQIDLVRLSQGPDGLDHTSKDHYAVMKQQQDTDPMTLPRHVHTYSGTDLPDEAAPKAVDFMQGGESFERAKTNSMAFAVGLKDTAFIQELMALNERRAIDLVPQSGDETTLYEAFINTLKARHEEHTEEIGPRFATLAEKKVIEVALHFIELAEHYTPSDVFFSKIMKLYVQPGSVTDGHASGRETVASGGGTVVRLAIPTVRS
jgi:hypothetical protein